jgi:hypothetical protein
VRTGPMSTPKDFAPRSSGWFSSEVEYVGCGRAYFAAPRGSIAGPATVSVDEAGRVNVRMVPEAGSLTSDDPAPHGMRGFLGGEGYAREVSPGMTTIDLEARNPCDTLEVATPLGTFVTDDVAHYGTRSVMGTGEVTEANFAVGLSRFEAASQGEPAYWVLPLANFLSDCGQGHLDLDRHPLRVFPAPEVPEEVTPVPFGSDHNRLLGNAWKCLTISNSKNRLITFAFGDGLGFVERLPDYAESERMLLEGKTRRKTTAVMVGPTGDSPVSDFGRMREWFPFDVLSLLTLVTGAEVGLPWVEIRDARGGLIRRLHGRFGVRPFRKGRRLVEEKPLRAGGMKATGRLIECALSRSDEFGENFLRAAIVHLVRARQEERTIDDSVSHLARGFETLCKRYRTSRRVLAQDLGPARRADVDAILDAAARDLRQLGRAGGPGSCGSASLDRIADRVRGAGQIDNAFGVAVSRLLKAFWLPDAHILEERYKGRPLGWAAVLAHYRGDVTHHGYLDILEAGHDTQEIADVVFHLHDALARVILKILRFDGGYKPGTIVYDVIPMPVDWVKPHFHARALGYKK